MVAPAPANGQPVSVWQLSLDFGTVTGWACWQDGQLIRFGSTALQTAREARARKKAKLDPRAHDCRPDALRQLLGHLARQFDGFPSAVAFEDVQFCTSTAQAQLWASLRCVAWLTIGNAASWSCVAPGTLKKYACRNGAAEKADMLCALPSSVRESVELMCLDDNAVDAYWLGRWARFA
jgi:hypothetical protein